MAKRKPNPRLFLRLLAAIILLGALALGLGLPALLLAMSGEGATVSDPEALGEIVGSILMGGVGAAFALFVISFFVRKPVE